MIKRTTARTLALLLALLSVFLFLSGCAKKPEPIMYVPDLRKHRRITRS